MTQTFKKQGGNTMTYESKLRHPKQNNPSLITTIPKALVDELGLTDTDKLTYTVTDNVDTVDLDIKIERSTNE